MRPSAVGFTTACYDQLYLRNNVSKVDISFIALTEVPRTTMLQPVLPPVPLTMTPHQRSPEFPQALAASAHHQ